MSTPIETPIEERDTVAVLCEQAVQLLKEANTLQLAESAALEDAIANAPRCIKRRRRSADELNVLLEAVQEILAGEDGQITIRHLFYRLESLKLIPKTELANKALGRHLTKWRRQGAIDWTAFADLTRWYRGDVGHDDAAQALENAAECYRKNLWLDQSAYVEIWCEKDAIASILMDAAKSFGVYVFPCRGFSSLTALHNAAEQFKYYIERSKRPYVAYFGDHDPSGVLIDQKAASFSSRFSRFCTRSCARPYKSTVKATRKIGKNRQFTL